MGEHWYDREGRPCYEVVAASGLPRPTTLSDARKLALVPSVTTVLGVLAKPALETWKVRQGILAALTYPGALPDDEAEAVRLLMQDAEAQAKAAAEEGSRIHDACECYWQGRHYPHTYQPHVAAVCEEIARLFPGVTDWIAEKSFCHLSGFGGKVDLHSPSTGIVVDYKGKDGDFSDGKKLAYDQHYQLAAYQVGLGLPRNVCANIFVSRTHPGKVASHRWREADIDHGWRVFEGALLVWKHLRKYDPAQLLRAA